MGPVPRDLGKILFVAALLRFGLLALAYPDPARVLREDSVGSYMPLAHTLLAHGRFANTADAPADTLRTPGYPAFLAAAFGLLGDSVFRAMALQALIALVTVALVWTLAGELAGPACAPLAALVAALDPPSATHSVLVLTETLFSALVAAAYLALWRGARRPSPPLAAAGGLALGLAVLVRPIGLYLCPAAALFVALAAPAGTTWSRRALAGALTLALALAPPLAWMARNQHEGAGFMLSSIEGANLLYYRAAPVLARVRGLTWQQAMDQCDRDLAQRLHRPVVYAGAPPGPAKELALEILRAHPRDAVLMVAEGSVRFWAGAGIADIMLFLNVIEPGHEARWPERGPAAMILIGYALGVLAQGWHLAVLALAAAGLVAWARARKLRELAFAAGTLALFTLLSAGPGAYARFRIPTVPLVAALAAAGFRALRRLPPGDAPR